MGFKMVTGKKGKGHITSDDETCRNQSILGNGSFVANIGSKLYATAIDNNTIRLSDGELFHQGKQGRIPANDYEDVTINNGELGKKRNDLICMRVTKNASTSLEDMKLIVIQGTSTTNTPQDPAHVVGDIRSGALVSDMPLYRVTLEGISIVSVTQLFSEISSLAKAQADILANFDYLNKLHSNGEIIADTRDIDLVNPTGRKNTKTWCVNGQGSVSPTYYMPPTCELGFRTCEYLDGNLYMIKILELYPIQGRTWTNIYNKSQNQWAGWVDNNQVSINGIKCQKISEVAIPSAGTQVSLASIGDASNILCTIGATAYDKYVSSVIIDASIAQEFVLSTFWNTTAFISCLVAWNPSTKLMNFNSIERGTNWNTVNPYIRFYKIL
ncbi:hypothetical protein ACTQ6A_13985 [Lachnospiraceae bacterium LCP25S3_G4]